jgi:hypothetical protein
MNLLLIVDVRVKLAPSTSYGWASRDSRAALVLLLSPKKHIDSTLARHLLSGNEKARGAATTSLWLSGRRWLGVSDVPHMDNWYYIVIGTGVKREGLKISSRHLTKVGRSDTLFGGFFSAGVSMNAYSFKCAKKPDPVSG